MYHQANNNNGVSQEDNELIQLVFMLPNEVLEGKLKKRFHNFYFFQLDLKLN